MESFKRFMEATATIRNTGGGVIDNDGGDDGDDSDEWDFDNVRKTYWDQLLQWVTTNKSAAVVRFNVYNHIVKTVRPKIRVSAWAANGNVGRRAILKVRSGTARAILTWLLPMDSQSWDTLVQEQRDVLSRSDVYKVFGDKGREGSAAMLFKGDVLEVVVYLCCAFTAENPAAAVMSALSATYGTGAKGNSFTQNLLKMIRAKMRGKIEEVVTRKVSEFLGESITIEHDYNYYGNTQSYNGNIMLTFDQSFSFSV